METQLVFAEALLEDDHLLEELTPNDLEVITEELLAFQCKDIHLIEFNEVRNRITQFIEITALREDQSRIFTVIKVANTTEDFWKEKVTAFKHLVEFLLIACNSNYETQE